MKQRSAIIGLFVLLFLALAPAASASSTWYVDGVNGNDSNDCLSSQTACQTIAHAIALCASGDSVMVAPATYTENLTINFSLKIIGADAATTIVDGNQAGTVIAISNGATDVVLSKLTIRNGTASDGGGGILNYATTLTINNCIISGNRTTNGGGGGIANLRTLAVNKSSISGNRTTNGYGGGIYSSQTLTIENSTLSGNVAKDKAAASLLPER